MNPKKIISANILILPGVGAFRRAMTSLNERGISEAIVEGLKTNNLQATDIDMLIPHQANLRISQFVQKKFKLTDDQVFNNIQNYGNTTAASIPIALCEAWEKGLVKEGDLVCLAAFGSGFTWASALVKW